MAPRFPTFGDLRNHKLWEGIHPDQDYTGPYQDLCIRAARSLIKDGTFDADEAFLAHQGQPLADRMMMLEADWIGGVDAEAMAACREYWSQGIYGYLAHLFEALRRTGQLSAA